MTGKGLEQASDEITCHEHQEGVTRVFECDAVQGCENGSNSWFQSAEDSNAVVAATNAQSFTVTFLVLVVHLAMPSQRMTKEEYIVELETLGETPVSWTLPELKMRLHELKESLGLPLRSSKSQTQFRTLVIEMNKCRKKADLQEFTRGPMQLHMTGNETMETLQKMCLRRIYESTKSAAEDPVGFGAHSALSYEEIYMHQEEYCRWVKPTAAEGQADLPPDATCRMAEQHGPAAERRDQAAAPSLGSQEASGPEDKNSRSAGSSVSSSVNEELMNMIKTLQEEVSQLKEERPRKKPETQGETMSTGSFRVVSP